MSARKKIAVILSGNGVYDGAEIHESVFSMLAIARQGALYALFAPDKPQHHVINHLTGEETGETRNMLVEAARIARGKIQSLEDFSADGFDAILFPGGFGVAKNFCSFAFDGANCSVDQQVAGVIRAMHEKGKPIGALCISPVLLTKVLGNINVTIGKDQGTAQAIEALGGTHTPTTHKEVVVDKKQKIVTGPCYMLDASIDQIADGAEEVVKELLVLMD